jgi:hypothetical protein
MINLPNNLPADRRGIEEVLADMISGKTTPTTPTYDVTDPNFKFEPDLSVDYGKYGEDYNFDKSAYENYMEATRTIEDREREDLEEGVKKAKRNIFFNKMGKMGEALDVFGASKDGRPGEGQSIEGGFKGFSRVGASKVPQTRRFEDGGIASLMPMYMDDGGYASGFGFGNFGTDFTNPFLDFSGFTDEELEDYLEAIGDQNAANSITYDDAFARGYGAPQADRIAEGTAPSKLNYEDTPSNILPGADIKIYARDENPAAYKFYPSEVSKLYSQMKGVPFSPLVAPPKEATYVDSLQPRRIQSQLYAKDGTYVQGYAEGTKDISDNVIRDMYLGKPDYREDIDYSRNMKPGTPEDFEKRIYLLEKEIVSQFKAYHGAVEDGFEEQAAAKYDGIEEMMDQRLQLKDKYNKQFNSSKRTSNSIGGVSMLEDDRQRYADGTGSMGVEEFPRRQELITGPGGERGDKIPAMLSDGEFVTNSAAVRGMGIMAGANPEDEYEQRLLGARQMYDYQKQAEEMAKRYA